MLRKVAARQTGGVVDLSNIDRQRRLLARYTSQKDDIEDCRQAYQQKLNAIESKTALDLSEQSTDYPQHFNVVLERNGPGAAWPVHVWIWRFAPAKRNRLQPVIRENALPNMPNRCAGAICGYAARGAETAW